MRIATLALLVSALAAVSAMGQALTMDYATVDLTTTGVTTIAHVASGSGFLGSVGCTVLSYNVTGSGGAYITTTLGTSNAYYYVYSNGYFDITFFPYMKLATDINTWGRNNLESFLMPMNVSYSSGLTVSVTVTTAATAGQLKCMVLHS